MAVFDAGSELAHHLANGGTDGVIDGFRKDVRTRGDKMRRNTKRRAGLDTVLDVHMGLFDLEVTTKQFKLFADKRR
jgi:hypothetical protein